MGFLCTNTDKISSECRICKFTVHYGYSRVFQGTSLFRTLEETSKDDYVAKEYLLH